MQDDSLKSVLREWEAPEPPVAMDSRIRAAYRKEWRPSPWRVFWSARISVPAPVLAALALIVIAVWLQVRSVPAPVAQSADRGFVTRLDATGFQPLPNGPARVVPVGAIAQ